MKRPTIEQSLMAARPDHTPDGQFSHRVMREIKNREIMSQVIRRENVKSKETFIMKLRKLHTAALVAIILAVTLGFTGTAYAIYALWPKASVEMSKPTVTQEGRVEIGARFAGCQNNPDNNRTYEIKKGSTITPEQVLQILQAHCEVDAVDKWARDQHPEINENIQDRAPERSFMMTRGVHQIDTVHDGKITVKAQPRFSQSTQEYIVTPKTKIVASTGYIKASDLKPGDVIVPTYIHKSKMEYTSDGTAKNINTYAHELAYIFKMTLPFEAYDPIAFQSLAERRGCSGNEEDICVNSGSVDLYMGSYQLGDGQMIRTIQGKITAITPTSFTVKGSSGREITFNMGKDILADYNQHRSVNYNNVKISVGDAVLVNYKDSKTTRSNVIPGNQVATVKYLIELVGKSDPLKKY